MTAYLQWQTATGVAAFWNGFTHLRFKSALDNTNDNNDPLIIPSAGTNYSYDKACRVAVTGGTFTQLSNLRLRVDTDPIGTGLDLFYGFTGTYAQPSGATDSTIAVTDFGGSTNYGWLSGDSSGHTMDSNNTGQWGDLVYFQIDIGTTASAGEITDFTITARYDEI